VSADDFVVQTERLLLRRWRDDDREPFAAMNADPEVMRYFPAPMTREASDAFVRRMESRFEQYGVGLWALELRDTGDFLGFTGLNPMPEGVPGEGGWEVGWRLARRAWGQGYATEAGRVALFVAFGRLALPEVWSLTAATNTLSRAVMMRLGLVHVATADHTSVPDGPLREHVFYRIQKSQWKASALSR